MTARYLPVEVPVYAQPCQPCGGRGVTGERYEMDTGAGNVLLLDVICPACEGCGNGDPGHLGCPEQLHASTGDDYDFHGDGDEEAAPACYSCGSGRGWNTVQGFTEDRVYLLRVPCGCAESRMTEVPA